METNSNVCSICNGTGLKITDREFEMEECECIQIERIRNHVKELKTFKFLKETKLLPFLNKNTSLIIETNNFQAVKCHIKTALVLNGKFKSFKIMNPGQLVALSIDNPALIEGVDLLVIESPSFPHYENASKRHEFSMATREALGKPTWFVIKGTFQNFKNTPGVAFTEGFIRLLNSYSRVHISESETASAIKSPNTTSSIKVVRGAGLTGVNPKLLNFHPEMDKRLHEVRE